MSLHANAEPTLVAAEKPAPGCRDLSSAATGGSDPDQVASHAPIVPVLSPGTIVPIVTPSFVPQPSARLRDCARLVTFRHGRSVHGYGVSLLQDHGVVNDVVAGLPVAITWCHHCGSGVVFARMVGHRLHTFALSGALYQGVPLLSDHETGTLWSAVTGKAIAGPLAGQSIQLLTTEPATRWRTWRELHPNGGVLSVQGTEDPLMGVSGDDAREDGVSAFTGPYAWRTGEEADEAIVGIAVGAHSRCYPWRVVAERRLVVDRVGDAEVLLCAPCGRQRASAFCVAAPSHVRLICGRVIAPDDVWCAETGRSLHGRADLVPVPTTITTRMAWMLFYPRSLEHQSTGRLPHEYPDSAPDRSAAGVPHDGGPLQPRT